MFPTCTEFRPEAMLFTEGPGGHSILTHYRQFNVVFGFACNDHDSQPRTVTLTSVFKIQIQSKNYIAKYN